MTRRGLAVLAVVGPLFAFEPAAAHGPTATESGYVSNVSAVAPNVLGVFVNVLGSDVRLRLSNYSGKTVVIQGYQGEPYLRFDTAGVFQNDRSPAAYVNRFRGLRGLVPASANPSAPPSWRKVADGASYAWRDHRIYWVRSDPPPGVRANPDKIQRVFTWRVPGTADGKRFAIYGILGYAPALNQADDGRDWLWPFLASALVAAAVIGLWVARRRTRRATRP